MGRRPCRSSSSLPHAGLSEGHRGRERLPLQQNSKIHYHRAHTDDHVADNSINAMLTHDVIGAMSVEYDHIHKNSRVNMTVASLHRNLHGKLSNASSPYCIGWRWYGLRGSRYNDD